ncbi:MAG TPA: phospholipase C, phosphocholine-specific [Polyangiaceae bacterium]|nr:phospholipase C, phosphocholine-specific [Polyangiaceae bacterium]
MSSGNRREFLRGFAALSAAGATLTFPPEIQRALAISPHRRTGTIQDVEHVVILMQENRSFDHYFGTLAGVRGFGDRFPIPVPNVAGRRRKSVWQQPNAKADQSPAWLVPFPLNTQQKFEHMRVTGTPHSWRDAQYAWADGKLEAWPRFKNNHSLGYFTREDLPFQFALAEAFTLCDAYHCSFQGGTNPNRLFLWSGTNDGRAAGNGPAIDNSYDNLEHDPSGGYTWLTYSERLQSAGVSWQVYQNMADNFTDNPLAGFRRFRDAYAGAAGALAVLKQRGLSTRDLELLKQDVLNGSLPQVSWIVATAEGSEHPGPSSPAQGAEYTARVLDALTANPEVWSKTVLFVNFDENDGFFDHVPPPAPPSLVRAMSARADAADEFAPAGGSTADTTGEYHEFLGLDEDAALENKPYGLGPRVPMYVVSPWSRGGWVNSEVFDHTSVIRFIEARFGVREPNISAWRRTVCGDLTSAFDFGRSDPQSFVDELPDTVDSAARARALPSTTTPAAPETIQLPLQDYGVRLSRALPYELNVHARVDVRERSVELTFSNTGHVGAVFHVYDRRRLDRGPSRYTVEPGKQLRDTWLADERSADYDLWVLGPNGFHRHFTGNFWSMLRPYRNPEVRIVYESARGGLGIQLRNPSQAACSAIVESNAYFFAERTLLALPAGHSVHHEWSLRRSANWYDFTLRIQELPGYARRFAGRVETGRDSFSDPAMGGQALIDWTG